MRTPTPMVDAVAFVINRDEVCPAQFARGLEAGLAEALRQIEELREQKLQALQQQREILDTCISLVEGLKFRA